MTSSMTLTRNSAPRDRQSHLTEELIREHLPLVGHLVRELLGRLPAHVSRDELTSAGMMALVTSAQGFDADRGVPFARFATIRIRGALTDELRSMDWASRAVRSKAREYETARQQLTGALGRTPTREEIATVMGVATSELPERLRMVVEEYFYGQRRMADIAADLGVTESRVSQLRSEALALLRDGLKGQEVQFDDAADDDPTAGSARADRSPRDGARVGKSTESDKPAAPAAKPSRKEAARKAYVAAIASRSTLAARLSATTTMGETREHTLEGLRAAQ